MKTSILLAVLSLVIAPLPLHATPTPPKNPPVKVAPINQQTNKTSINLNTADVATLTHACKGIGPKRAQAIIEYREMHHGFKTLEELAEVKGFSQNYVSKNLETLKAKFTVG